MRICECSSFWGPDWDHEEDCQRWPGSEWARDHGAPEGVGEGPLPEPTTDNPRRTSMTSTTTPEPRTYRVQYTPDEEEQVADVRADHFPLELDNEWTVFERDGRMVACIRTEHIDAIFELDETKPLRPPTFMDYLFAKPAKAKDGEMQGATPHLTVVDEVKAPPTPDRCVTDCGEGHTYQDGCQLADPAGARPGPYPDPTPDPDEPAPRSTDV